MQIGAITFDIAILGGPAVFTGTRIPVKHSSIATLDDFAADYSG